jgi:uncharacterized membrane protein YphA (DoxX/SURF4 family)
MRQPINEAVAVPELDITEKVALPRPLQLDAADGYASVVSFVGMGIVVWIAAGALALTFILAGVGKVRDLPGTVESTIELGVPKSFARPIAAVLPFVEFVSATMLVLPTLRIYGALLAVALLLIFSTLVFRTLREGRSPMCRCFGAHSTRPIDRSLLVRNAALMVLGIVVLGYRS